MRNLAQFCYDKRRYVLVAWIALLAVLFLLSTAFAGEYKSEFKLPGSESQAAFDLLAERGVGERTGFTGQIVFRSADGIDDPTVRRTMEAFFDDVRAIVEGEEILSPYDPENAHQIAPDGKTAFAEINFSDRPIEQMVDEGKEIKDIWREISVPGLQVELGGDFFAEEPAFQQEIIGLIAAVIILVVAFGSLIAMGLPIVTALFGIGGGVAIVTLMTRVLAVPDFTEQVALMIGIGVGIDYSLLIVTRYRSGLQDGLTPRESVALAMDTSGRAVLFAGMTIVIALLGMFFLNLEFIRAVALSVVLAVLMTMGAAITLLPALLGFIGRHIDRFGLPYRGKETAGSAAGSFWYRWSRVIQAHPWPALLGSAALLLVLTIPLFSIRLGFADAGNRVEGDTTRRAYDMLSEAFGPGFNGSLLVLADMEEAAPGQPSPEQLAAAVEETEGVARVTEPQVLPDAGLAMITVFPDSAPQDEETADLVHRLRNETVPAAGGGSPGVLVAGFPAVSVDFSDYTAARLPIFIGAVLLLSFLLLMVIFHSVVVPLKAVLMNLLGIGAAFGAIVAVFQWGFLGDLFGVGREGPVEAWAPMMLFAIIFGLSMDYEVFLLTRIREEYDRTGDNARAVADGLAATGRVITAAALIMVSVFGSFVLGDERALKLMGFGLAFAVLLDATVVRMILVPSAMELLGRANWWARSWLVRVLPTIRVDSVERPRPEAAPAGGGD